MTLACEYISSVKRLLACRISSCTTLIFSPLATSIVEKVCRNVCHPILFFIPARCAAGRITLCKTVSGQNGYFPWWRGLAKIQSPVPLYLLVSFQIQRSAATRPSNGTGLRDVSVLQSPICCQ